MRHPTVASCAFSHPCCAFCVCCHLARNVAQLHKTRTRGCVFVVKTAFRRVCYWQLLSVGAKISNFLWQWMAKTRTRGCVFQAKNLFWQTFRKFRLLLNDVCSVCCLWRKAKPRVQEKEQTPCCHGACSFGVNIELKSGALLALQWQADKWHDFRKGVHLVVVVASCKNNFKVAWAKLRHHLTAHSARWAKISFANGRVLVVANNCNGNKVAFAFAHSLEKCRSFGAVCGGKRGTFYVATTVDFAFLGEQCCANCPMGVGNVRHFLRFVGFFYQKFVVCHGTPPGDCVFGNYIVYQLAGFVNTHCNFCLQSSLDFFF